MIKGLKPQLSKCGHIKIGGKGKERKGKGGTTYRLPVKYDHFVVTKTYRDADDKLVIDEPLMKALLAEHASPDGKLREIPVRLSSDDIETAFKHQYELYAGKQLACEGNGETARQYAHDKKTKKMLKEFREVPCPCPYLEREKNKCKASGTLRCSIRLPDIAIAGADYSWHTTSTISIAKMLGSFEAIRQVVGQINEVPLMLVVTPVKVSPEGKAITVYTCHLELRASDLLEVQRAVLEARKVRLALTEGKTFIPMRQLVEAAQAAMPDDEREEIADEFHHDETLVVDAVLDDQEQAEVATTLADKVAKQTKKPEPKPEPEAKKPEPKPEPKKPEPKTAKEKAASAKAKKKREAEFLAKQKAAQATKEEPPVEEDLDEPDYGSPDTDEVGF